MDGEDSEGNMIRGSWRNDAETATGMTSSNRCVLFNLSSIIKLNCRYLKSSAPDELLEDIEPSEER